MSKQNKSQTREIKTFTPEGRTDRRNGKAYKNETKQAKHKAQIQREKDNMDLRVAGHRTPWQEAKFVRAAQRATRA